VSPNEPSRTDDHRPILDSEAFRHRLDEEVARVRRSGGFLSIALFKAVEGSVFGAAGGHPLADIGERLRRSVRLEDVLAERAQRIVLLMPDTSAGEAARAAERLLAAVRGKDSASAGAAGPGAAEPVASAGVATAYGELEGGGTALLAAAEEALREAPPGQFAPSRTLQGRPRLLVVDDDRAFAQALAETISERGWEAHPCADVADARERVKDASYSGFFVAVVLPRSSGIEILHEAVSAYAGRPAVLMSGQDADPAAILEALSLGPVMFIRKPMGSGELDSALAVFRQLIPGIRRRVRLGH
jgi:PleD family two-component response regulator